MKSVKIVEFGKGRDIAGYRTWRGGGLRIKNVDFFLLQIKKCLIASSLVKDGVLKRFDRKTFFFTFFFLVITFLVITPTIKCDSVV